MSNNNDPYTVVRDENGLWHVINKNGDRVSPECSTEQAAWHWFDKLA